MNLLLDGEQQNLGKSKWLWLLDPGHGGMVNGKYTTAPAKMHDFGNGVIAYEGVINRDITRKIIEWLKRYEIDYAVIPEWDEDTSLEQRVRIADAVYAKDKRSVYLSIHSNAGGGQGWEIFSGPGQTESDRFVKVFADVYKQTGRTFKFRGVKEENFYVLRKTDCPALLVENLFFDNAIEAKYLMSTEGQQTIAAMMFRAIQACEEL